MVKGNTVWLGDMPRGPNWYYVGKPVMKWNCKILIKTWLQNLHNAIFFKI